MFLTGTLALASCSGPTSISTADKREVATPTLHPIDVHDANSVKPASEAIVRLRLNALFREHQLRIVNDYPCSSACFEEAKNTDIEVTLDGFDPQSKIGYEYIAPAEIGLDLDSNEEKSLRNNSRIFIVSGNALEQVEKQALQFLDSLPDNPAIATP